MSKLKTALLAVVAVAGITTIVIQHRAAGKLRAENHDLLEQNQTLAGLQAENERLSNLSAHAERPRLSREEAAELLRLRGQVGQLREALAARRTAAVPILTAAENEPPNDPAKPFTTKLTTQIADGQTLVTGGWSTTPGKRTFMLVTPVISPADGITTQVATDGSKFDVSNAQVTFETCTIEIPEAMLDQFGVAQFKTEGQDSSVQTVLAAADADALLKALANPPDGVSVAHGQIIAPDGIQSTITTGPADVPTNGEATAPEYTIGLTGKLTADQTAMNLSMTAQVLSRPINPSPPH